MLKLIVTLNHEIFNPLTVAQGCLYRLKKDGLEKEYEAISNSLERSIDVVNNVNEISNQDPETIESSKYTKDTDMVKISKGRPSQ